MAVAWRTHDMNPSRLFILRPVATSLFMVAILLAGLVAYRVLPLSALPEAGTWGQWIGALATYAGLVVFDSRSHE